MACLGPFQVRRVPFGPAAKIKHEAIITFQSLEVRDAVRSAARNLAGKSEYGVRLEIPNSLKSAMNSLQSASFEIRQKFPNSRRNVLFDDESMSLVLDFCTTEGGAWRRMTARQAKERKKKAGPKAGQTSALGDEEIDDLLDGEEAAPV